MTSWLYLLLRRFGPFTYDGYVVSCRSDRAGVLAAASDRASVVACHAELSGVSICQVLSPVLACCAGPSGAVVARSGSADVVACCAVLAGGGRFGGDQSGPTAANAKPAGSMQAV